MRDTGNANAEWRGFMVRGSDPYRYAGYWVKRYAALYSIRWDDALVSDVVCEGYSAYLRVKVIRNGVDAAIKSKLRTAAFRLCAARAEMVECGEIPADRAGSAEPDYRSVLRVAGELPAELGSVVLAIATSAGGIPSQREIADQCGVSQMTACRMLKSLRRSDALQGLLLESVMNAAAAGV